MWGAIFPGQGSQHVGMGKFLFDNFRSAQLLFEEASDVLSQDFRKLCFEGPESDLTLTENTQPALVLVSTITFKVLSEVREFPFKAGSGHSVGEYSAVVTAGGVTLADALKAVRLRGQFMQQAVPVGKGGMVAVVGLSDELVRKLCQWTEEKSGLKPLQPANYNAPGQVVISGSQAAIDWLKENFKAEEFDPNARKVRLIPLNVSAPFHCDLMKPAEEKMSKVLGDIPFGDTRWPIVQNVVASPITAANDLRKNLVTQVSGAVRWTDCVNRLKALEITHLIEFGSGRVLSGLVKKIDSQIQTFNINSLEDLKSLENLNG